MTDTTSTSDARPESFTEVVASKFAFLVDRGFRFSVESDTSVVYEAPNGVFVRVHHDPRDRYVGFYAGLVTRPRDALTDGEFARLTGAKAKRVFPEGVSALRLGVDRLARLLEDYGERILSGDESILDEAKERRREYTKQYTKAEPPNKQRSEDIDPKQE